MKNIRSNCMTKPPCDWLGQRRGGGGGGGKRVGVRECGEQRRGGGGRGPGHSIVR